MKHILLLMASCIVLGCSTGANGDKQFTLDGVWTLRQMDYPAGGSKTLEETKELLGLIGFTLSEHLFVDRIISYCLSQNEYDYDVDDINEIIYDITKRSTFIKY